jgi:hypothetical protein
MNVSCLYASNKAYSEYLIRIKLKLFYIFNKLTVSFVQYGRRMLFWAEKFKCVENWLFQRC